MEIAVGGASVIVPEEIPESVSLIVSHDSSLGNLLIRWEFGENAQRDVVSVKICVGASHGCASKLNLNVLGLAGCHESHFELRDQPQDIEHHEVGDERSK